MVFWQVKVCNTRSLLLHYLASNSDVKTVCETGFSYGYSAFNYLTANDQLVVHSFDLPVGSHTKRMAHQCGVRYPRRIYVHFGNSIEEVPIFIHHSVATWFSSTEGTLMMGFLVTTLIWLQLQELLVTMLMRQPDDSLPSHSLYLMNILHWRSCH
jgi:hypothetical protein